jgi:hypothetical protein
MLVTMFPRQAGILIIFCVVHGAGGGRVCRAQGPQPNAALSSIPQSTASERALPPDGGAAAGGLAAAAQAFGQVDDITVLSIMRKAAIA